MPRSTVRTLAMLSTSPAYRLWLSATAFTLATSIALMGSLISAMAQTAPSSWPVLPETFESTGGGGWIIENYRPVVIGDRCFTEFKVLSPDKSERSELAAAFTATPHQGGILCTDGRFVGRSKGDTGTTPLVVWIKDGVVRRAP